MSRALTGLLVVLLLAVPVAASPAAHADVAGERDGPLPRVDRVGPIVDDEPDEPDDPDGGSDAEGAVAAGRLGVAPAIVEVVVAPDRRREVRHVVTNTTDRRLHLDLDVVEASATPDGPGPGRTGEVPVDAPVRLVAPVDGLVLDPGEGAVVISTAQAVAGEAGVFALRVRTRGAEEARAYVVVAAEDLDATPALELDLGSDGTATLTVRAPRPTVVDVRLTGRSWVGADTDQTVADLLVGPDGRELDVDRPATRWPGPVRAAAYVTASDGDASAEAGRLVLPRGSLGVATLIVLALLVLAWRRHRTARARGHAAAIGSRRSSGQEEP
jgi:hypothetical protein